MSQATAELRSFGVDYRSIRIALNLCLIRVPKLVPLLELFSSKAGTFEFQGRNFRVPREELSSSKRGIRENVAQYCKGVKDFTIFVYSHGRSVTTSYELGRPPVTYSLQTYNRQIDYEK